MIGLQIVRGRTDDLRPKSSGHFLEEDPVRFRKAEPDRVIIDFFYRSGFAVDHHVIRWTRLNRLVIGFKFPPVENIVGGKGMAVRPAHSLPEMEGELPVAVTHLVTFGDMRYDRKAFGGPAQEGCRRQPATDVGRVNGLARGYDPCPPVASYPLDSLHHHGFGPGPLCYGRELPPPHQFRQMWRFCLRKPFPAATFRIVCITVKNRRVLRVEDRVSLRLCLRHCLLRERGRFAGKSRPKRPSPEDQEKEQDGKGSKAAEN